MLSDLEFKTIKAMKNKFGQLPFKFKRILLIQCIFTADIGDYIPDTHGHHYLSDHQLVPNPTQETVNQIIELHKLHK